MTTALPPLTAEHVQRFHEEGFFVLEDVLGSHDLQSLRADCQRFVDLRDAEMDRLGVDRLQLDHRGRRYFVHAYGHSQAAQEFLFSDLMATIARTTLSGSKTGHSWAGRGFASGEGGVAGRIAGS
ncbi:MAG TPA: hypothetical protein VF933_01790 [Streptosporangiaceae bacterium]